MSKKINLYKVFSLTVFCGMCGITNPVLSQETVSISDSENAFQTEIIGNEVLSDEIVTPSISEEIPDVKEIQNEILPPPLSDSNETHQETDVSVVESLTQEDTDILNEETFIAESDLPTEEPELSPQQNNIPTGKIVIEKYTWADFVAQKDCRNFAKELEQHSQFKELSVSLKSYCNTVQMPAWKEWLHTLRQEKKNLLISQTLKDKSAVKYIKVLPYFFFDIQNTKPNGNTPKDILNRIQQAVIQHQAENALSLILELPQDWQKALSKTTDFGKRIVKIKEDLNKLNLINQEANND